MPVLVIAAYDKAGTIQTMNAAWGQICDTDKIALFPVAMQCTLAEIAETKTLFAVVGTIVNTLAEERVLDEQGKVDPAKLDAIAFDQFRHGYYATGEKAGQAWNAGSALAKAALGR